MLRMEGMQYPVHPKGMARACTRICSSLYPVPWHATILCIRAHGVARDTGRVRMAGASARTSSWASSSSAPQHAQAGCTSILSSHPQHAHQPTWYPLHPTISILRVYGETISRAHGHPVSSILYILRAHPLHHPCIHHPEHPLCPSSHTIISTRDTGDMGISISRHMTTSIPGCTILYRHHPQGMPPSSVPSSSACPSSSSSGAWGQPGCSSGHLGRPSAPSSPASSASHTRHPPCPCILYLVVAPSVYPPSASSCPVYHPQGAHGGVLGTIIWGIRGHPLGVSIWGGNTQGASSPLEPPPILYSSSSLCPYTYTPIPCSLYPVLGVLSLGCSLSLGVLSPCPLVVLLCSSPPIFLRPLLYSIARARATRLNSGVAGWVRTPRMAPIWAPFGRVLGGC